ncbi:hypothetical protein M0P65_01730 [Candidatus Gracilibacteria bacterium]|nr:hypothetical protein [Candidatus Gracilibacteria bacterium]
MNNKPAQVSPQNDQFGINNEVLSVDIIKKEFLTIIDNFTEAIEKNLLKIDFDNADIVQALLHGNIPIINDLTLNEINFIFHQEFYTVGEIKPFILNEINAFMSEYGEFFKGGDIFREIFHKSGNQEDIGLDHKAETRKLIEIMSHNLCLKKHKLEGDGKFNIIDFNLKKIVCKDKLDDLSKIDLNIPGYIVLLIFRNILNEQENVKDFLSYASIIQNSFTVKDTAFGERIDEFFLKYTTVESTVDKVNKSLLQNIGKFFTKRD